MNLFEVIQDVNSSKVTQTRIRYSISEMIIIYMMVIIQLVITVYMIVVIYLIIAIYVIRVFQSFFGCVRFRRNDESAKVSVA